MYQVVTEHAMVEGAVSLNSSNLNPQSFINILIDSVAFMLHAKCFPLQCGLPYKSIQKTH